MDTFLTAQDGTSLFYSQDFPEEMKAAVVLVHGVNEHCGRYRYVTERLKHAGYGVMRFDLRGHGKSGGERGFAASVFDFPEDVHLVVDKAKFQADILGMEVHRTENTESTALGATFLAGLSAGLWEKAEDLSAIRRMDRIFTPQISPQERDRLYKQWGRAVKCSWGWELPDEPL